MQLNEPLQKKLSRFMALILRHRPEVIGLELDHEGWCELQVLLQKIQKSSPTWRTLNEENIRQVVENCNKQRFTIKNGRMRANQGHSNKNVEVQFSKIIPKQNLYHGTSKRAWQKIQSSGLLPMNRHHVHLSADIKTAVKVGKRYDKNPILLKINIEKALADGIQFYISENNVYLCEHIPADLLEMCTDK
ncbi:RNA 2'-phosphotransferase [Candidatus Uabimicrobium sp. HlEnr_7]|uniref:RNA 2'-phosphotransferase n=1 Tax=Candidatus Uabimicrobium helgolandensis TaxID=3095367 RepID=UPI003557159D